MSDSIEAGGDALVVGASGAIGAAVVQALLDDPRYTTVHACSRGERPAEHAGSDRLVWHRYSDTEAGIAEAAQAVIAQEPQLSRVVISSGVLHRDAIQPEKRLEALNAEAMMEVYRVNAVVPGLWLSALAPLFRRSSRSVVAVLAARVGSIGDNRSGGWYSYRSAKAALVMLLKSAAIELQRRAPGVKLVAFHPGTTDSALSRPFQKRVAPEKLFTPAFVAGQLLTLLDEQQADGELAFLDWAGKTVPW